MQVRISGPLSPDDLAALTRHAQEVNRQRELAWLAGRIKRAAQRRDVGEVARLGALVAEFQAGQERA